MTQMTNVGNYKLNFMWYEVNQRGELVCVFQTDGGTVILIKDRLITPDDDTEDNIDYRQFPD